jgi:predicted DNA-binding transcriptional regulator YafY
MSCISGIVHPMRASRLLNILLLLQTHGRMSAERIAEKTETSVRTIHRDIEELSAAGVPVRAARGAAGGFELMEGWRTRLTGLTPAEAQAMIMAGAPGPAAQLGLGAAAASAQLKMLAALPPEWQADARRVGARFHLDPVGWYRREEQLDYLPAVADAVWNEKRLRIRYESWKSVVDRRVEPLGLVLKAGAWYLVATSGTKEPRTYRLSNILALHPTGASFKRPAAFDLACYWNESIARFEAGLYRGTATVRASKLGLSRLRSSSAAVAEAIDRAPRKRDKDGWTQVAIPIESVEHAAAEILKAGAECEVVEPPELRKRMAGIVAELGRIYAPRASGKLRR